MMNNPSPLAQLGSGMQQGNGLQLSGGFRQQPGPQMGGGFMQRPGMPQMSGGFQAQSPLAQLGAGMAPQMSGGMMQPEVRTETQPQSFGPELYSRPTFGGALTPNMIPGSPGFGGGQQMPGGRNPINSGPQMSGGLQQPMPQLLGGFRDGR